MKYKLEFRLVPDENEDFQTLYGMNAIAETEADVKTELRKTIAKILAKRKWR